MSNHSFLLSNISVWMYCSHTPATFYRLRSCFDQHWEVSYDFIFRVSHRPALFFLPTAWNCYLRCLFQSERQRRERNEIKWITRLETAAETRHQTHFVFILPHWVQLCLCLWRAPCLSSQCPFPWPCYWHWTVIHRISEQIGFSDHWLRDRLRPEESRMMSDHHPQCSITNTRNMLNELNLA